MSQLVRRRLELAAAKLRSWSVWLDAQPLPQRAFLLVALIAALFSAWDLLLMRPFEARRGRVEGELETLHAQVQVLENEVTTLEHALATDPDAYSRARRGEYSEKLARLDAQLGERTSQLIRPAEMPEVLRELLRGEDDVVLVRMETLDVEPVSIDASVAPAPGSPGDAGDDARIFRHGLQIELSGSYLAALRYFEAIEGLPWRLFWDSLEYEVEQYPKARITLRVHSLSMGEGWIGA